MYLNSFIFCLLLLLQVSFIVTNRHLVHLKSRIFKKTASHPHVMMRSYQTTVDIDSYSSKLRDNGTMELSMDYNSGAVKTLVDLDEFKMDSLLSVRTTSCLDFQYILDTLHNLTTTVYGKLISSTRSGNTVEAIRNNYQLVSEISGQLSMLPIRSEMNIWPMLTSVENNGSPPDKDDFAYFADTLQQILDIKSFLIDKNNKLYLYEFLAEKLSINEEVHSLFLNSFDDNNNLNSEKFPELGKLRSELQRLQIKIVQTIQALVKSDSMKQKLEDDSYVEINDRYCLMLKNTHKKGVGIVHGTSNSGKSLYVEPFEIVEPTNEVREIRIRIKAEETKILFEMFKCIANNMDSIKLAAMTVGEIDVYAAKSKLGNLLHGTIPEVGDEGVLSFSKGRHPILLLRGVNPIHNSLHLTDSSALVISGPNAGGKTIILKMAGLFVLMTRHSIPLPVMDNSRIDLMEVMADIGDMQTVSDDLSTFSGHLVICQKILENVLTLKQRSLRSLVLLDEIGTGTDPAQGAALAQAVLEELVNLGSLVIVTTHYQRIKELAVEDSRFKVSAMEFIDNRPTYRLRLGYVGESYALEAGRRMNLPENILNRANELLDDESKKVIALQQRLEEETLKANQLQEYLNQQIFNLNEKESSLENRWVELREQIEKIKQGKVEEFLGEIRQKEQELEKIIEDAQHKAMESLNSIISSQSKSLDSNTLAAKSSSTVQEAKSQIKNMRVSIEKELIEVASAGIGRPLPDGEPINEGTTLVVLEKGNMFGLRCVAVQKNKGRGKVFVRIAGVEMKLERHQLGIPFSSGIVQNSDLPFDKRTAKEQRLIKMLEEDLVNPSNLLTKRKLSKDNKLSGLRIPSNTIDLRKVSSNSASAISDMQRIINQYLEKNIEKTEPLEVIYLQHSLSKNDENYRSKLRSWIKQLPFVQRVYAADSSDGGDAFTIVELNLQDE